MNHGFVKIASAVPPVRVADCRHNVERIEEMAARAEGLGAEILCLPELSLTSYSCQDLFGQQLLLEEAEAALLRLMELTRGLDVICAVGLPVPYRGALLNCAAVVQRGRILGLVPKTYLPNYGEFYEKRWFTSAADVPEGRLLLCGQQVELRRRQLFRSASCTFGVEICEDLWAPEPPSTRLALAGAEVILNLSADNDTVGKYAYLKSLIAQQSARAICGYVFSGCGFGESTQDVVFGGKALICENGVTLAETPRHTLEPQLLVSEIDVERLRAERRRNTTFASCAAQWRSEPVAVAEAERGEPREAELTREVDPHPFVPQGAELDERCEEILSIQAEGLAKRVRHSGARTLVVGISGGLDSTLALLVCVRALDLLGMDRKAAVGITMPGFGTTDRTRANALTLMRALGVTMREISIRQACALHLRDLGHEEGKRDVTYENAQARERTQILMDEANRTGGLVVGTGDLSELALGWATYNGDHMSMYAVNTSVPKTLVRHLVRRAAERTGDEATRSVLLDIADTPVSPELLPAGGDGSIAQRTEDIVGPYELHDFFLYHLLRWGFRPSKIFFLARRAFRGRYSDGELRKWLTVFCRRFFAQQFKRSCLPDGPKVGSCSLSPRGDWRMASDAAADSWLRECARL